MRIDANAMASNISRMVSVHGSQSAPGKAVIRDGVARSGDIASFSPQGHALGRISALLGRLSALTRNIGATPDTLRATRADIAGIETAIESALARGRGDQGVQTSWVSGAVTRHKISQVHLEPGQTLDVEVNVTQSAQQGGLYLSFGGSAPWSQLSSLPCTMTINVGGVDGTVGLTFTSGSTMADIAATINARAQQTGTQATPVVSGGGVGLMLRSNGFGSSEFVSVGIVDPNEIGSENSIGIYRLAADNTNAVDPTSHVAFNSDEAAQGIPAAGQDVQGTINGISAAGYGTRLFASLPNFAVLLDLATGGLPVSVDGNAQTLGSFLAMRLTGVPREQEHAIGYSGGNRSLIAR